MTRSVVIIDDDADTIECLRIALKRAGYQVATALNGRDGLALIQRQRPDLALVDVMMPDISGYDVCREVRADPDTANTIVILLSARSALADQTSGLEAGADRYLIKPVSLRELIGLLDEMTTQPALSGHGG